MWSTSSSLLQGPGYHLAHFPLPDSCQNSVMNVWQILVLRVTRERWAPSSYFLGVKSLWPRKYDSHKPGPLFCPYCHFSRYKSSTPFYSNTSPGHLQRLASVWVWQVKRGVMTGKNENNKLTFDSLLAGHGQRQRVCRVDDMCSQCLAWLLGMLIKFRHAGTMDWDLTKLPCEIWRALAFVPWTALAAIHTWKMANYWQGEKKMWVVGYFLKS